MLSLYPISLTHNKQLERYNEMARSKTYRWKGTNSKRGDLFGFYFYGKFIRIHEIMDCQDLLILTQQLIEISWEEWVYLNGPRVTKTKQYDLIHYPLLESKLSKLCKTYKTIEPIINTSISGVVDSLVSFKEPLLEVPCAKIMKRFINNLNKEVEYDGTLWQIIYCLTNYGNVSTIWKRRDKLLLNVGYYQNNSDIYPGNILHDFRIIAEKYGKWSEYIKEKFEINNNKIIKYDGIKKEYLFLDSKSIKWYYYENTKIL
jgi:hypothetical protein